MPKPKAHPSYIAADLAPLIHPIGRFNVDPANTRLHPELNRAAIRASLARYGQRKPIVVQREGMIVRAGNGTIIEARELGWKKIAAVIVKEGAVEAMGFAIADNRSSELATWDGAELQRQVDLIVGDVPYEDFGFTKESYGELLIEQGWVDDPRNEVVEDEAPEVQEKAVSATGDLWLMGEHRVLCGDSTKVEDVGRVMGAGKVELVHADPPYGMGKEKDGIANDNLYRDKLDAFQMSWWQASRQWIADNASAYIWGNAEDLWRLWFAGGLRDSERMTFRNEIVWAKGSAGAGGISHMGSEGLRTYPTESERCLFFMLGEQGFNNNADNYWEGWDSVVNYLRAEKKKTGWDNSKFKRLAGHSESSGCHWFDKSQWMMPTKEVYEAWQSAAREHDAFKREHDELKREFYATRAHFDNTHDNMTDVWSFPRVTGEERHGHATPKPVALVARCLKSSLPDGSSVLDPFLGSGTTVIAAEQLGRRCYGLEIEPKYVDVIVKRWQNYTEQEATLEATGQTFAVVEAERGE